MNILQIKETCIYVKDLDITEKFYRDTFGFAVISKIQGRHVFFRAGNSVLLCFDPEKTKNDTSLPPHFGYGQIHLAFEVEAAEYGEWKTKILEKNIKIIHEQQWKLNIYSFYFHDPDGHLLEIVPKGMWG